MYKSELARLAGVSSRTFARYLATRRQILSEMGVSQYAQMLPPKAVKYVSEDYCIDLCRSLPKVDNAAPHCCTFAFGKQAGMLLTVHPDVPNNSLRLSLYPYRDYSNDTKRLSG